MNINDIERLEEIKTTQKTRDLQWNIVKSFRKRALTGQFKYYYLIECKKCGNQKFITNTSLYSNKIKCENCYTYGEDLIGKTIGPYKILELDHENRDSHGKLLHYFKVECIHCHTVSIRQFSPISWKKTSRCINCGENRVSNNSSINGFLGDYKRGAAERGIKWNLSNEEFLNLINQPCHYCGKEPEVHKKFLNKTGKEVKMNGIDRIDSSKDYSPDNCVPCCSRCNIMKFNIPYLEFLDSIKEIYNYRIKNDI